MSMHSIDDIAAILEEISMKLDSMSKKLDSISKPASEESKLLSYPLRRKIYDLCDGTRTVKDILREIEKTNPVTQSRVSQILSKLEERGLIESKRGKGENWRSKYYYQTASAKTSN